MDLFMGIAVLFLKRSKDKTDKKWDRGDGSERGVA